MLLGFLMAVSTLLIGGSHTGYLHISIRDKWRFDPDTVKSITRIWSNAVLEQFGTRFGFFITARFIFALGTTMYAAHQIAMQLLNITFTLGDGLGVAATALVGQNLGRKRSDLSMLYGKCCQRMAVVASLVLGVLILVFRNSLASMFIGADTMNADQVIYHAAGAMIVMALVQPFQTSAVVLYGSLRGAGDNLYVAFCSTICVSVIRPILTLIAVEVLHLELAYTWIFLMLEIVFRYIFSSIRFASGKWKNKRV